MDNNISKRGKAHEVKATIPAFETNARDKRHIECPYLYAKTDLMGRCKISGGTEQSGHDFEKYCLSASAWHNCPNYVGRNQDMFP